MKSSEPSMSVAISKHEREGLSGISTNPDSKCPVATRMRGRATRSTVSSTRISVSVSKSD